MRIPQDPSPKHPSARSGKKEGASEMEREVVPGKINLEWNLKSGEEGEAKWRRK